MPEPPISFEQAIELLFAAHRALIAEPDRLLAKRRLGRVHHRILYCIRRCPGLTVSALCVMLGVTKQALHGPLAALEKAGLVARSVGVSRRERCLTLTTRGASLEAELATAQRERFERAFREAGPEAIPRWEAIMRALC